MAGPNVRVLGELQAEATLYAAKIGVSLNALVAVALRDYLDQRKASESTDPAKRGLVDASPAPPKRRVKESVKAKRKP